MADNTFIKAVELKNITMKEINSIFSNLQIITDKKFT